MRDVNVLFESQRLIAFLVMVEEFINFVRKAFNVQATLLNVKGVGGQVHITSRCDQLAGTVQNVALAINGKKGVVRGIIQDFSLFLVNKEWVRYPNSVFQTGVLDLSY